MDGISVMVFVVRCASGLLMCDTQPTDHLQFATMENCEQTLPKILSQGKQRSEADFVWMGKCVYRLSPGDKRRERRHKVFERSGSFRSAQKQ